MTTVAIPKSALAAFHVGMYHSNFIQDNIRVIRAMPDTEINANRKWETLKYLIHAQVGILEEMDKAMRSES